MPTSKKQLFPPANKALDHEQIIVARDKNELRMTQELIVRRGIVYVLARWAKSRDVLNYVLSKNVIIGHVADDIGGPHTIASENIANRLFVWQ